MVHKLSPDEVHAKEIRRTRHRLKPKSHDEEGGVMKKVTKKVKRGEPKARKVAKAKVVRKPKKNEVALLKQQIARAKRESNAKEMELNRLREEVEYKNGQLASKDIDMESYKRITDEKIFQLEAKVKELEAKAGGTSFPS